MTQKNKIPVNRFVLGRVGNPDLSFSWRGNTSLLFWHSSTQNYVGAYFPLGELAVENTSIVLLTPGGTNPEQSDTGIVSAVSIPEIARPGTQPF